MGKYIRRLWLVALPFAVALLFSWLFGTLFVRAANAEGPQWDPNDAKILNQAAAAGLAVAASFSLLLIFSIPGAIFAGVVALRRLNRRVFATYSAIGIAVYVAALLITFKGSDPYIDDLGKSTFCATVGRYFEFLETSKDNPVDSGIKPSALQCDKASLRQGPKLALANAELSRLTDTIEVSAFASVLVLVAVTLCIAGLSVLPIEPPVKQVPKTADKPEDGVKLNAASRTALNTAAHDLAERIRYLKYLAVVAAAVLGSGVAYLKSWAEWPLAFWNVDKKNVAASQLVEAYQTIATSLVNFEALFFVAIMLAVFGPFALILSRRGRHLAALDPELIDDPEKRRDWLTHHGLALTTGDQIQRVLLFISPLLAAPVAELFKQLVGMAKI